MREKLYHIIEPQSKHSRLSNTYDIVMMIVILLSFIPLIFRDDYPIFGPIDVFCVIIFIIDYILRWITADFRFGKESALSFVRYPVSVMAIIDLMSILPILVDMSGAFRAFRVVRLIRALRVIRVLKIFRYSTNMEILASVFRAQRRPLILVMLLAVGYILFSAMVIFQVEPATFGTYFEAVYWATISLATVGYGDIYATSFAGKLVSMISVLVGIAVIALPAGIITAGYMEEMNKRHRHNDDEEE